MLKSQLLLYNSIVERHGKIEIFEKTETIEYAPNIFAKLRGQMGVTDS